MKTGDETDFQRLFGLIQDLHFKLSLFRDINPWIFTFPSISFLFPPNESHYSAFSILVVYPLYQNSKKETYVTKESVAAVKNKAKQKRINDNLPNLRATKRDWIILEKEELHQLPIWFQARFKMSTLTFNRTLCSLNFNLNLILNIMYIPRRYSIHIFSIVAFFNEEMPLLNAALTDVH